MSDPTDPTDPTLPPAEGEPAAPGVPPTPEEVAARRRRTALIIGGVVVALLALALVWALRGDDDGEVVTGTTTSAVETTTTEVTTTEATTTTSEQATTTEPGPAGPLSPDDAAFVVWPAPDGDVRYDDPVDAVTSFATELARFTDPIVSEFRQGDSRSGEVEIRAVADGAVSTVLVRQFGTDGSWWVTGALTPDIELDDPQPQGSIDDPLIVSGRARAFEGTVLVAVFADGSTDPLGTGFVTGSGDGTLGPFEGEIRWSNPGGGWGTVLLYTESAEDGSVWQVSATRVGFIGGD